MVLRRRGRTAATCERGTIMNTKPKLPLIKDIRALLIDLKSAIDDEYRAYDDCDALTAWDNAGKGKS